MDLLCNSYADSSDEELEHQTGMRPPPGTANETPPSKRPRPSPGHPYNSFQRPPFYCSYSDPQTSSAVSIPGRYVSKRERSLHKSLPSGLNRDQGSDLVQNISAASPTVLGSIADSELPCHVLSSLRYRQKGFSGQTQMPSRMSISLSGHTKAVTAIDWSTSHVHLLASAGLDGAVYVWNVWSKDKKKARAFHCHDAPVKDVKWSKQGLSMLSCGYDCSSRLVDVEKGIQIQTFKEDQVVGVVKFDPDNYNTFLSGGLKGSLRLWDIRTNKVVHEYIRDLGPILDVEFVNGGERFISSSDVSSGNTSENAIIVWDIKREVPLSNQVYSEAYTCPCIKRHPRDPIFVAQSNGNYIAIFSTNPPFKLNKYMRYESHWVSGFPVKCSFSPDGQTLASGSADGSIYIYGYKSSDVIKKIKAYEQPCLDIAHHPVLSNVIASCSWDGEVSIFE
ncbi:PREDICTED: WD repeat-containing protein 25 isoform X1 [Tarenaya hassleriana]|uniref:WD repeat-containing protein 25 isoform X1 n=1 Tax=Tarenaya hassleriana TaxID=28532 RepID=UPI00053C0C11|nr:PREDICTED: WD repeat-containing protein 25 isoform X1 [Tarenaya hassleriana]